MSCSYVSTYIQTHHTWDVKYVASYVQLYVSIYKIKLCRIVFFNIYFHFLPPMEENTQTGTVASLLVTRRCRVLLMLIYIVRKCWTNLEIFLSIVYIEVNIYSVIICSLPRHFWLLFACCPWLNINIALSHSCIFSREMLNSLFLFVLVYAAVTCLRHTHM